MDGALVFLRMAMTAVIGSSRWQGDNIRLVNVETMIAGMEHEKYTMIDVSSRWSKVIMISSRICHNDNDHRRHERRFNDGRAKWTVIICGLKLVKSLNTPSLETVL